MIGIADKIKASRELIRDPEARELLKEVLSVLPQYTILSSYQFPSTLGLFNSFIEQFLNVHAYIGAPDSIRFPSYDPIKVAYTENVEGDLVIQQWIALWTNTFILHTEYPTSPDLNVLIIAIDSETYNNVVKVGKEADELFKQSII